jgi:hypothetical protein
MFLFIVLQVRRAHGMAVPSALELLHLYLRIKYLDGATDPPCDFTSQQELMRHR